MAWTILLPSAAQIIPTTGLGAPRTNVGETLLGFESDLQSHLGIRTDLTSDELRLLVNRGYVDFCTSLRLAELQGSLSFNLIAGQPLYLFPQEVFSIEGLYAVNSSNVYPDYGGRQLDYITTRDYRALPDLTADVPAKYAKRGQLVVIYPTPEAIYPVRADFRIRPDYMTLDAHSPLLEPEWHEGIMLAARAKGHRKLLEFGPAREAEADVADFIRRRIDPAMEDEKNRRPTTQPLGYKNLGRHYVNRKPYVEEEW